MRNNGRDAVGLAILRQSQANTVAISNAVRAEIDRIASTLPDGMEIEVSSDDALFVAASIHEVVEALFISLGIVWDGWRNSRAAVLDLIDQRARTEDDARTHPLIARIANQVQELPWVRESAVRVRDMGQVFHVEVFAVPVRDEVRLDEIEDARAAVAALDWKVQDVVVVPTATLPDEAEPASAHASQRDA